MKRIGCMAFSMNNTNFRIAAIFLIAVAFAQPAYSADNTNSNSQPPASTSTILLCTTLIQGQPLVEKLNIDFGKKIVNGVSASFTDTTIKWTTKSFDTFRKQENLKTNEFNRLSGTYTSWADGVIYSSPPPSFDCAKASSP